jgi:hypothetical protein
LLKNRDAEAILLLEKCIEICPSDRWEFHIASIQHELLDVAN